VVVVEVLSRSTRSIDTGRKFRGYFRVPSIQHYLVVEAESRFVLHHRRDGDSFRSEIVTSGAVVLDPPGLTITVDEIYDGVA
jgi:Uma2 family endonuclease